MRVLQSRVRLEILKRFASSKSLGGGNQFDYDKITKDFQWNFPAKFNFAQDVIDAHAKDPTKSNRIAFHHVSSKTGTEQKWTFQELSQESKAIASGLLSIGNLKRALIILPRIPEWWFLNIAAMRTKTVLLPGTTQLTANDLESRLRLSQADAIIADPATAAKVDHIAGNHKHNLKFRILVTNPALKDSSSFDCKAKGWINLNDIVNKTGNPPCPDNLDTCSSEVMQIFFTSGTTGAPKMCPHTHGSYGYCHWITGKYWLDLTPDDLHWNISDTGWAKSAWSNIFGPWSQAAGVFVHDMPRFEASQVLKVLGQSPITTLCAPPTLYRSLVLENDIGKENLKSLRHCVSAGEPLNEEVIRLWYEKTGLWIREGYGQTETTLMAATFKGMDIKPGSMGKPAPGYDIRIVDNHGVEVVDGQEGNIALYCDPKNRPGGLFNGYLDNPDKTAKAFSGNFYLTGDTGYKDRDGYIWFSSRQDDVIISAGYRIGPFEVESALLSHPAVIESAAVASPDSARGHVVKAFVVLNPEFQNERAKDKLIAELQDHVKKMTAPYKYPRKIEFVDSLPKTVSGKIRRAELKALESLQAKGK